MSTRPDDSRPPDPPWHALTDVGTGYLSFYYSDPLAKYPVRELTRPRDNKSDPNLETGTYGLFSTCEPSMRNRIITDGVASVFFVTSHGKRRRAITGYYHVGWYTEGVRGAANRDWALAADTVRFVDPIPLEEVAATVPACAGQFRTQKRLDAAATTELRGLVDERDDLTNRYVAELHRIERFARTRTGYAYPSWGRPSAFTWADAPSFYRHDDAPADAPNSNPTNTWLCTACGCKIPNVALLKQCPACHEMATLTPVTL